MSNPTADKSILDKINKVLELADASRGASEAEVQNAMGRAKALMAKYGLSVADVSAFRKDSKKAAEDTFKKGTKTSVGESGKRQHLAQFEQWLAHAVAEFTGTVSYINKWRRSDNGDVAVRLVYLGDETDVAIAVALMDYLLDSCKSLARQKCGKGWTPTHRSYAEGFANGVYNKVQELKKQEKTGFGGEVNAEEYALVQISKADWLKGLLNELGIKEGKEKKARGKFDVGAYIAGKKDGAQADLNLRNKLK